MGIWKRRVRCHTASARRVGYNAINNRGQYMTTHRDETHVSETHEYRYDSVMIDEFERYVLNTVVITRWILSKAQGINRLLNLF